MNKTDEILQSMLKENTGRSFLDSGDHYGRHYEKNQKKDFCKEPYGYLYFGDDYMSYTKSVYHHLRETLEYSEEMNQRFLDYIESKDPDADWNWFKCVRKFIHDPENEFSGMYRDGEPFTENTYNCDNTCSQVVQFGFFSDDGEDYVLLQIHNGCDVRGGYTKPRAFRVIDFGIFFSFCDGIIKCPNDHLWYMNEPYEFEPNWTTDADYLNEYEIIKISDYIQDNELYLMTEPEFIHRLKLGAIEFVERLDHQLNLIPDVPKPVKYQIEDDLIIPDNVIWVTEDDQGLCPLCYEPLTADV